MSSESRIAWSDEAVQDLAAIHDFIARTSPHYAEVVAARLVGAVDRLQQFPESGRIVPELGEANVREVIHGAYRIVYQLRDAGVQILTVFRASRRFPELVRRDR